MQTHIVSWFFQTPNGNVEAKVMCFFRRRDLPSSLVMLADKHQQGLCSFFSYLAQDISNLTSNCYCRRFRWRIEWQRNWTMGTQLIWKWTIIEAKTSAKTSWVISVSTSWNSTSDINSWKMLCNFAQWNGIPINVFEFWGLLSLSMLIWWWIQSDFYKLFISGYVLLLFGIWPHAKNFIGWQRRNSCW